MTVLVPRLTPRWLVGILCCGIAAANFARTSSLAVLAVAAGLVLLAFVTEAHARTTVVLGALLLAGLWWGSARLDALDRSPLSRFIGTSERARVVVTGPPRSSRFQVRVPARVERFGTLSISEPILLELPVGRSPPQGSLLEVLGVLGRPRAPSNGFDEATWLRRHGVHVVLKGDSWRVVGRRGGLAGVGDAIHAWLARRLSPGLQGERRALLAGFVLGDDQDVSADLRLRFRASGLYHLMAVSGENIALVAGGALLLGWLLGLPRWLGELGALGSMGAYVLAVGAQPSVLRAGIAGALGSLAWLTARQRDRWQFLLLAALVLLAWNPYTVFDAGFQLSFAAVVAIFTLAPRIERFLEGYPLPRWLRLGIAISTACGVATAPVLWFQFHSVPVLTVIANAAAAPIVPPLLYLAFATAAFAPLAPGVAHALAWLNGWCAEYLAGCARAVGGLPFAQVQSGSAAAIVALCTLGVAAYAWQRCRT